MTSHYGLDLHIADDYRYAASFHMIVDLWRNTLTVFLIELFGFLLLSYRSPLHILSINLCKVPFAI
jgi:hypothetical protein